MNNLADYLKKFTVIITQSSDIKKALHERLASLGISVPLEAIEIKGNAAYIRCHPLQKSEMFMKKSLILKDLMAGPNTPLRDIR